MVRCTTGVCVGLLCGFLLLTNDEKQKAAQVRHTYEVLLTEMEQAPTSSETLTTMLSTFRPRDHELLAWPLSLLRSY